MISIEEASPNTRVPAVLRCIAILRVLDGRQNGASLASITSELGITKSHCLNILRTLQAEGWVRHDPDRRVYRLDPRLLQDLANLIRQEDHSSLLHQVVMELSEKVRLPCVLTRINPDDSFIAIDKAESGGELMVTVPIGHLYPWDAPAQLRARLIACDAATRDKLIARWEPRLFTLRSHRTKHEFLEEIALTLARGYAVSRGEYAAGVMSIAVPVKDRSDRLRMILQCPGLEADLKHRESEVVSALHRATGELSRLL